jgi:hypothetical protein
MISIVHNQTQKAIEIHLDVKGADLLVKKLEYLKLQGAHLHLYATNDDRGVSMRSPYQEKVVYGELILNMLPSDAWDDLSDAIGTKEPNT